MNVAAGFPIILNSIIQKGLRKNASHIQTGKYGTERLHLKHIRTY